MVKGEYPGVRAAGNYDGRFVRNEYYFSVFVTLVDAAPFRTVQASTRSTRPSYSGRAS